MKKSKPGHKKTKLTFDEILDLYEELYPGGKFIRTDAFLQRTTPRTLAGRLRETINLSQLFLKIPRP